MARIILHFDLDCFYTQVERRRLKVPDTIPVACVQWGSLLSVDYQARKLGISRRSSVKEATEKGVLCVHSQVIDIVSGTKYPDGPLPGADQSRMKSCLARYRDASEEVMTIAKNFLPEGAIFERASIDEAYCDITACFDDRFTEDPVSSLNWYGGVVDMNVDTPIAYGGFLGERLRDEIREKLGFHMTVGIARTRETSKLLCGKTKPDKTTCLSSKRITEFMKEIPLGDVPYLGPRLLNWLSSTAPGISKETLCSDLWALDLGSSEDGKWVAQAIRGLVNDPVKETGVRPNSIQASRQFRPPLVVQELDAIVGGLVGELIDRLDGRVPKTLSVQVSINYEMHSRQGRFPANHTELLSTAINLIKRVSTSGPFNFVAVAATGLEEIKGFRKEEVSDYFIKSRLSFMGSWKSRYIEYLRCVEDTGEWGDAILKPETLDVLGKAKMESKGDRPSDEQLFMLVDMDCFFCSVALLLEPSLPTTAPAAVVSGLGPTSEVCSPNYPARAFGVKANSFVRTALERCPTLKLLKVTPDLLLACEKIWKNVLCILAEVGGIGRVSGRSCDEALLDLSGICAPCDPRLDQLARAVQTAVSLQTGCPCSVGIAPTRVLAKVATSEAKPAGFLVLPTVEAGRSMLHDKPVTALSGVGFATEKKLQQLGVCTVGELLTCGQRLVGVLGTAIAKKLLAAAEGQDLVDEDSSREIRSVSAEKNFGLRNINQTTGTELLLNLASHLRARWRPVLQPDRLTLKLLLAGDDWVEPSKHLGCGHCQAWSKSTALSSITGLEQAAVILAEGVEWHRIRGAGLSLRVAEKPTVKPAQRTLHSWMKAGPLEPVESVERPVEVEPVVIEVEAAEPMFTEMCSICGTDVVLGELTKHLSGHLRSDRDHPISCEFCQFPVTLGSYAEHWRSMHQK